MIVFILSGAVLTCQAQDWPQWRGSNRDGKVTGFKAPQEWPTQLTQTWKVSVGSGDATPALVQGKLYVFTKLGGDEILQCLDAASGRQIWQTEGYPSADITGPAASHPGPRSSVAFLDGKVVTLGVWGDVACFDASDGKLLWRNETYKNQVPRFNTGMSPLLSEGVCFTHLGGPDKGTFVAFDLATGSVKWKVDGEGPAYGSPVLVNINGTKQIVFQSLTKLASFNVLDGKLFWEFDTPVGEGRVQNATSPVADQNRIYFTGLNNGVNAIEINQQGNSFVPSKLWTNPNFSTGYNTPIIKDGYLYGFSGQGGKMFCMNTGDGQTAWEGETVFQSFGSLVDAGEYIIGLSGNSKFVVLKPNGQKFDVVRLIELTEKGIYAYPILSGNSVFIKDEASLIRFNF
ncbi:MAG: PQQ-binding-like beta-propeller repeat protein [Bacteroidales bacterium]